MFTPERVLSRPPLPGAGHAHRAREPAADWPVRQRMEAPHALVGALGCKAVNNTGATEALSA